MQPCTAENTRTCNDRKEAIRRTMSLGLSDGLAPLHTFTLGKARAQTGAVCPWPQLLGRFGEIPEHTENNEHLCFSLKNIYGQDRGRTGALCTGQSAMGLFWEITENPESTENPMLF